MTFRRQLLTLLAVLSCGILIAADEKSEIEQRIREHFSDSVFNATLFDKFQERMKEKCIQAGGSENSYDLVKEGAEELGNCARGLVDIEQFQEEVELAKPTGDLDTVFNKYCRKRNILLECVNTFSNTVDACLDDDERVHKVYAVDVFKNLLNFVCHKDGDQIALFIAEGGPECFKEKQNALITCFNQTFSGYFNEMEGLTVETLSIPKLVIGPKQCQEFTQLQTCLVRVLEQCSESTPANLVESLLRYIRKGSPCDTKKKSGRR